MKTVCELDMCAGCGVCVNICPKDAVSILDTMKNLNAVIDEERCINCGACENVCQQTHPLPLKTSASWFQGWNTDDASRAESSSGGAAFLLMRQFIREGGYVCSCAFSEGEFPDQIVRTEGELERFRGSKYVKSDPGGAYSEIRRLLKENHKVLFLGLPCHVGALKKFIGDGYENQLYTVDLICHGSPSVLLFTRYMRERGICVSDVETIRFRQKTQFRLTLNSQTERQQREEIPLAPPRVLDRYTIGFLNGLFYTENCYACQYASLERVSDITIGDAWGSELEGTDEGWKGISLALCQTEKGEALLKRCGLHLLPVDLENVIAANHQLKKPTEKPISRERFFSMIESGKSVHAAVSQCYPKMCAKQDIKRILSRFNLLKMRNPGGGVNTESV